MKGIITLCGSTRFKKQYEMLNRILELNDWAVFTVASFYHKEKDAKLRNWILKNKIKLDKLHLAKIELSQAIIVIDVGGYVGTSTSSEIQHAKRRSKPVYFWSDKSWKKLLKDS
ncbi:MAG: hypothetical protein OK439_05510 [Thaumarchaeota archaeon]|nr:hypothetical protein [Nitrososphaerota archaeon]